MQQVFPYRDGSKLVDKQHFIEVDGEEGVGRRHPTPPLIKNDKSVLILYLGQDVQMYK